MYSKDRVKQVRKTLSDIRREKLELQQEFERETMRMFLFTDKELQLIRSAFVYLRQENIGFCGVDIESASKQIVEKIDKVL